MPIVRQQKAGLSLLRQRFIKTGNLLVLQAKIKNSTANTRSERDFEMSLCYTPKVFSCLEEIKYNINHCLELAPSFPKMYNITMFRFNIAKLQS